MSFGCWLMAGALFAQDIREVRQLVMVAGDTDDRLAARVDAIIEGFVPRWRAGADPRSS